MTVAAFENDFLCQTIVVDEVKLLSEIFRTFNLLCTAELVEVCRCPGMFCQIRFRLYIVVHQTTGAERTAYIIIIHQSPEFVWRSIQRIEYIAGGTMGSAGCIVDTDTCVQPAVEMILYETTQQVSTQMLSDGRLSELIISRGSDGNVFKLVIEIKTGGRT